MATSNQLSWFCLSDKLSTSAHGRVPKLKYFWLPQKAYNNSLINSNFNGISTISDRKVAGIRT